MPPAQPVEHQCAHCHKPATRSCSGCKNAPIVGDETEHSTTYCSAACQKLGWVSHKKHCNYLQARKALYRVGSILQSIFFIYREKIFDLELTHVERRDGKVYIFEAKRKELVTEHDILKKFPSPLFSGTEERQAALTFQACSDASAWMIDLVQYFLTGLASNIFEFSVMVKNRKLEMILVDFDGNEISTDLPHGLLKIELKGTDNYVMDLAGAQYGHFKSVSLFDDYCQSYVRTFGKGNGGGKFHPAGTAHFTHLAIHDDSPQDYRAAMSLNISLSRVLKSSAEVWFKSNNSTIQSMLKLPPQIFEQNVESLLGFIASELDQSISSLDEKAALMRARVLSGEVKLESLDVEADRKKTEKIDKMIAGSRGKWQ